ncbi:hypothetical protein MEQU1_001724 [Malassezia equina]|uniref:Mitotic checkpoint regulator, MAD2B-interacting-domain-containing protein n=1 Tax=Malassezia equina TaxID=1381935 RepID=A0AAF0ECF3_9BASI|nr:hypothetical protein MEQU1_001724 [Malassezia equina]
MSATSLVAAYASDSDSDDSLSPVHSSGDLGPAKTESSFRMGLPAPKNAGRAPAKRQIKIEATPALVPEAPAPSAKRPRMNVSDTHSHSLFSMLPEPQQKEPLKKPMDSEAAKETILDDDVRLVVHDTDTREKKGNEDFRAMLGLQPKSRTPAPSKPPVIIQASLPTQVPAMEEAAPPPTTHTHALSAAPDVEERAPPEVEPEPEVTSYPGWKQDADGGWYPVTPEAHAQYAAWASHAQQEAEAAAMAHVPKKAALADFDVAAEMQRAGPSRPTTAPAPKPERENLVSERLRTDKFTNMRARNRGQLTSLLAMAHENRPMLEEKWAQGKSKMRENKKRYGF